MVKCLLDRQHDVVTFDNLSTGHLSAITGGTFVQEDLANRTALEQVFAQHNIDGVFHFASLIQVGESVCFPDKYYHNNVANTLSLLDVMVRNDVRNLVFSSSAAVYGKGNDSLINEDHPPKPINPYGRSKWMVEQILEDYDNAFGLKSISLRYFNAAGADPSGLLGERHNPETHLIPLALQVASGRRDSIKIFGNDYPTPDGTCIRDYIHVLDLCEAHLLAFQQLRDAQQSAVFNLGNGNGFSVQEVIDAVQKVTGKFIAIEYDKRRDGDPPLLVADSRLAREKLGWQPVNSDLTRIIKTAWRWEQKYGCFWT